MNCKPGDLAVVVKTMRINNSGAIVRVIRSWTGPFDAVLPENGFSYCTFGVASWVVESCGGELHNTASPPSKFTVYNDQCLRPIRDQDGTDEMIRIAGLPHKEHA